MSKTNDISLLCPAVHRRRPQPAHNARQPSAPHPVTPTASSCTLSSSSMTYGDLFDTTSFVSTLPVDPAGAAVKDRWAGWSYFHGASALLSPATPRRPSHASALPRSTVRRRPMTEDRAYREMLLCVEASATQNNPSMEELQGWNDAREHKLGVSALPSRVLFPFRPIHLCRATRLLSLA